jgi:DNA-binding NarL/FixJ family response regulator
VLVAEDSWNYAQALEAALNAQNGIEVIGVQHTAEGVMARMGKRMPDVVLADLELPEMGGTRMCELLRKKHPTVSVVIVSGSHDDERARQAIAAGARAFVIKDDHHDAVRIAEAIRSAARGDHLLDRDLHRLLRKLAALGSDPAKEAGLTSRECEVLALIAKGLQNKEIGASLGVSEQTARNHISHILRKLGAKNRMEAIAEARRRRIMP